MGDMFQPSPSPSQMGPHSTPDEREHRNGRPPSKAEAP